ncbi:hypothetical protein GWK48_00305 [Metallosphaera tengchongensis]|uniref:C4-dicarboxylate ABC transporter n=1 Tax=Metallosphaera tengchongensis TaxID=1532350 RepID=A0A6N0NV11_9CREN|nr:tellurite resistance/C4-dicarboxylate transporter family protein [Metallosphaera tengchongensis]QKQ99039.1 hypothetical protein GWK48_00305 [Metallosphaera tengchongensis]
MLNKLELKVSILSPSYFGMVMATGTTVIAMHLLGIRYLPLIFTFLNFFVYLVLVVMNFIRILKFWPNMKADLRSADRGPGFFTFVAGTDVLGDQAVLILHNPFLGYVLWFIGFVSWVILQYPLVFLLLIGEGNVSANWLLIPVSTMTVSVLSADLGKFNDSLVYVSLISYFMGWAVYFLFTFLLGVRLFLHKVTEEDLIPSLWINGGFPALASLSSSLLLLNFGNSLGSLTGVLLGTSLLIWSYGTWWIPILFLAFLWKHLVRRVSLLRYDFQFWSAVFPVAVYGVGTYFLAKVSRIPGILLISHIFFFITLVLWIYQMGGFLYNLVEVLRS